MFVVPAREGGDGYPEQSSVEFILSDTQATTGPELRRRWNIYYIFQSEPQSLLLAPQEARSLSDHSVSTLACSARYCHQAGSGTMSSSRDSAERCQAFYPTILRHQQIVPMSVFSEL